MLVTGAATGVGAAAVHVLNTTGATVAATYHSTPPPDDEQAKWFRCDVRDPAMIIETFGRSTGPVADSIVDIANGPGLRVAKRAAVAGRAAVRCKLTLPRHGR
jgi:NAD(P)-dependent dehydrogenase (short-subunit alcohol dehydrogenase family)